MAILRGQVKRPRGCISHGGSVVIVDRCRRYALLLSLTWFFTHCIIVGLSRSRQSSRPGSPGPVPVDGAQPVEFIAGARRSIRSKMPTWKAAKLDPLTNSREIRQFFWPRTGHARPPTQAPLDAAAAGTSVPPTEASSPDSENEASSSDKPMAASQVSGCLSQALSRIHLHSYFLQGFGWHKARSHRV